MTRFTIAVLSVILFLLAMFAGISHLRDERQQRMQERICWHYEHTSPMRYMSKCQGGVQ